MEVKYENRPKSVLFSEVRPKQVFKYNGSLYIRLRDSEFAVNPAVYGKGPCFCFSAGETCHFGDPSKIVQLMDAVVTATPL